MIRWSLLKILAVAVIPLISLSACQLETSNLADNKAGSCQSSKYSVFKVAAARRVLNPTKAAVPIGHGSNKPLPVPVYSDICTSAVVFEDYSGKKVVWISCDFMQVPYEVSDPIKERIQKKYGIDPTGICISAIHNHAAPPIIAREVQVPEWFDAEYAELFKQETVAAVGDALTKLVPAKLYYCEDICTSIAINRRPIQADGKACPQVLPNNKGVVDFKVQVVMAESIEDGKPIVILAEYAAHPVVTMTKYLGGEYPSYFRKHVERKFPGSTAMFFQGCSGNIRIQVLNEDRTNWIPGTPENADRFGLDLADAVERAIAKRDNPVYQSLGIGSEPIVGPIEAEYAIIDVPINREAAPDAPKTIPFRIQAFRFGSSSKTPFTLVALGAEAFIEYSLNLEKKLEPSNTIIIGYANDMKGYLPTAKAYEEGGYEPNSWREYWYALPGPYLPEVESVVLDAATKLAKPKNEFKN